MLFVRDYLDDQLICRHEASPSRPLVSIILPTYSRLRCGLLERSIQSLFSQTFGDFELIVIDDGSSDGTQEYLAGLCKADARVVHVRHERNSGLPALRVNEGILLARGQYVAFQFDDDAWRPNFLDVMTAAAARQRPETVIVGTSIFHHAGTTQHAPFVDVNHSTLFEANRFGNNCILIPRELFDRVGMYDCHLGMRRACDWDLWLRLIKFVPFHVVSEIVADVFTFQDGSIGKTTPWDISVFRYLHDIPRDHLLTPNRWDEYEVDALRIGDVSLLGDFRRRIYEEHIRPYYLKFRHRLPIIDELPMRLVDSLAKDVILASNTIDDGENSCVRVYDLQALRRGTYKVHHHHLQNLTADGIRADGDALLLAGVVKPGDLDIAEVARLGGQPVAYLLDEAMIPAAGTSEQSPGTGGEADGYRYLVGVLSEVDAVWVTDEGLGRAARSYNRRTVPHAACLPPGWLPDCPAGREPGRPLIIGYTGGRPDEEIGFLGEALARVGEEFGAAIHLVVWGDWPDVPPWSGVAAESAPEPAGYFERLARLRDSRFDILLCPRADERRRRNRPTVEPYHEAAVAGAVGVFSDVAAYAGLPEGETCLKAANTVAAWTEALRRAITLPAAERERMRAAGLTHVRETATVAARIDGYEAAWRATEFHRLTHHRRGHDGRPRVAYVFHSPHIAGAEIQLWRRLRLMPAYGVEPLAILPAWARNDEATHAVREELAALGAGLEFAEYAVFTEPVTPQQYDNRGELEAMMVLLRDWVPALVHSTTFIPVVGQACRELSIPHVASLFQVTEWVSATPAESASQRSHCDVVLSDSLLYAQRWGHMMGAASYCSRPPVPEGMFEAGRRRMSSRPGADAGSRPARRLRVVLLGTFQPRKGQLAAVAAIGVLRREGIAVELELYGYTHFYPEYVRACKERSAKDRSQDVIHFRGFDPDVGAALEGADILLCSSSDESFPTSISEAMAAGVLVVSTPVGGIPELIVDAASGVLCKGFGEDEILEGLRRAVGLTVTERSRIAAEARRVALTEFQPRRTANDLFAAYGQAIRRCRPSTARTPERVEVVAVAAPPNSEAQDQAAPHAAAVGGNAGAAATQLPTVGGRRRRRPRFRSAMLAPQIHAALVRVVNALAFRDMSLGGASAPTERTNHRVRLHRASSNGGPHRLARLSGRLRPLVWRRLEDASSSPAPCTGRPTSDAPPRTGGPPGI